jgi:hypothetical protein
VHHKIISGERLGEIASKMPPADTSLFAVTLDADHRENDDITLSSDPPA